MKNNENLRKDDLIWGGFSLYQNKKGFCFSLDAVILACFFNPNNHPKILDIGTGNGILPLLIQGKSPLSQITALEIDAENVALATFNMAENNTDIQVVLGNAMEAEKIFGKNAFHGIIANPPYYKKNQCRLPKNPKIAMAKVEIEWDSPTFFQQCGAILKDNGTLTLAYPPQRLEETTALAKKYGFTENRRLWLKSKAEKKPYLVILEYIKTSALTQTTEETLIIHCKNGELTPQTQRILKEKAWRN
ncbi:MAG: methyltransferase [Clostridiales bacterium]